MKKIFILMLLIIALSISTVSFSSDAYHCSGGLTGGGAGALDAIASPADNDIAYVHWNGDATWGNTTLVYTFDIGASAGEAVPWIIAPNTGSGEWELCTNRDFCVTDFTCDEAQGTLSEENMISCRGVTNSGGADSETDIILEAVSYPIDIIIKVEEANIIETCPPAGEVFDLDGTLLDANDCVDSPAIVFSKAVVTRMQNAAGTWILSWDTVRGAWVDADGED